MGRKKDDPLTLRLTPYAYWKLQWMCQRTPCEVSSMGLLRFERGAILVEDFILVKQEVSATSVELDMTWWADKQIELYESRGIEPWQTSCWTHTHPAGVDGPSSTDEETMTRSFGKWDFVLMIILTKDGEFYARMDFDHVMGGAMKTRFRAPCGVEVDWEMPGREAITAETLSGWEEEFKNLVREASRDWLRDRDNGKGETKKAGKQKPDKQKDGQTPETNTYEKEVKEYVQACQNMGVDPDDPECFEEYFGYDPASDISEPLEMEERFLRGASLIDQQRINAQSVAIVGVGAIGSHLAEMLAKLGVNRLVLIDPDEVDTVNLSVQGFYEAEVGRHKVEAVADRIGAITSRASVFLYPCAYESGLIPQGSAAFSCVDSMPVRRQLFRHFREQGWAVFLDGRMAAESLRVFSIDRSPEKMELYQKSLFPSHEAFQESCTARATIYCASMAAAILCAQYKKWAMGQDPEPHLQFDLLSFDCFR